MNLMQSGNAFVYYGEELGMSGSGKDENKRAPMYWSDVPGVFGVTVGPPEMEKQAHSFAPAVGQIEDDGSILQFVRGVIAVRNRYPAIARGTAELLDLPGLAALTKTWEGQAVLLVYNPGGEKAEATLPGAVAEATLADWLSATGADVALNGATLVLPAYSIAVLALPGAEAPADGGGDGE
jgi:glycosidase